MLIKEYKKPNWMVTVELSTQYASLLMSIRLWDVKIGYQKMILYGHNSFIQSVCFSPDGNTIASGSDDNSIRLWNVKTDNKKPYWMDIVILQNQSALLLMALHYYLVVEMNLSVYGMFRYKNKFKIKMKNIKTFQSNFKLHNLNQINHHKIILIFQLVLLQHIHIYQQMELQYCKENLQQLWEKICVHYLKKEDVVFWKTKYQLRK
ncbi:unnamed protein product [Paramecium sonneborni]|uniref:Uncharacterized protein n=1 Tax=Paramecium sonneborni TaxID=65129 RepID=A0A8S1RNU3_9CILI|nr:unnamed protein product [Paramecium sonneborni]